jgi:hypothetical protein
MEDVEWITSTRCTSQERECTQVEGKKCSASKSISQTEVELSKKRGISRNSEKLSN